MLAILREFIELCIEAPKSVYVDGEERRVFPCGGYPTNGFCVKCGSKLQNGTMCTKPSVTMYGGGQQLLSQARKSGGFVPKKSGLSKLRTARTKRRLSRAGKR